MRTAENKLSSQKGLSHILLVILVIIGIPILLIVGVFLYNFAQLFFFGGKTLSGPAQPSDLERIEDAAYIFYYPKGYVKGELGASESGEKDLVSYKNPNTKAVEPEEIFLRTKKPTSKRPIPSFEQCKNWGEAFRQKEDDEITTEVARAALEGKGVGCKATIKYKVPGVNDASVIIEKQLWDPQTEQTTVYEVRAIYFDNAGGSQAKILGLAVDQFALK